MLNYSQKKELLGKSSITDYLGLKTASLSAPASPLEYRLISQRSQKARTRLTGCIHKGVILIQNTGQPYMDFFKLKSIFRNPAEGGAPLEKEPKSNHNYPQLSEGHCKGRK